MSMTPQLLPTRTLAAGSGSPPLATSAAPDMKEAQGAMPMDVDGEVDIEEMRCKYRSKPCMNWRTTKRGGGLHRFCEFHRIRSNENQLRVDRRRRMRRMQGQDPSAAASQQEQGDASAASGSSTNSDARTAVDASAFPVGITDAEQELLLSEDELEIFVSMMLDDEDMGSPTGSSSSTAP